MYLLIRHFILLIAFIALIQRFEAQENFNQDSLQYKMDLNPLLISISMMTVGVSAEITHAKQDFREFIIESGLNSKMKIDDYLQHAPFIMSGIHILSSSQTKTVSVKSLEELIVSEIISIGSSWILKLIINTDRPNGGSFSFPSGHTSYAFTGAATFHKMLKTEHPFWSHSAYFISTATAIFRILRDKHWISDVFFGAGIGILSAELGPLLNIRPFSNSIKNANLSSELNMTILPGRLSLLMSF